MRILQVPYTFSPDPIGGTEVYVSALTRELNEYGNDVQVAAPGLTTRYYEVDGIGVNRFAANVQHHPASSKFDREAAQNFARIVRKFRPEIVHLHARTTAASENVLQIARASDARTVFTYHTPTVSCVRGSMMMRGLTPCDGLILPKRCTACVLEKHGLPRAAATMFSHTPDFLGQSLEALGFDRGFWLAFRMRHFLEKSLDRFLNLVEASDRIIAVCDWVAEVLLTNGVSEAKLVLNRQGLANEPSNLTPSLKADKGPLRVAFFGRLDPTKGIDVLIRAVRNAANAPIVLDVYGIHQDKEKFYYQSLVKMSEGDDRIRFHEPVESRDVVHVMRQSHLVAVPSIWLETGPLVVLEAYAAGVPVIGSRLGGIAELVVDNVDGLLIAPGNISAWCEALDRLSKDRQMLAQLQNGILPPRRMHQVAQDMSALYAELLD